MKNYKILYIKSKCLHLGFISTLMLMIAVLLFYACEEFYRHFIIIFCMKYFYDFSSSANYSAEAMHFCKLTPTFH